MLKVIPLRYGIAFKKAFSDPEVFSAFARDILGVELTFTRVEQERGFHPPIGKVDVRFDLFAEDEEHRAIVELQHVREADVFDRFHYYHMVAQLEQVTSSKSYKAARTVYTIVVLTRLPQEERLRFDMASQSSDLTTTAGKALGVFAHRMVFVNPRAIGPKTPERVKRWLSLLEDTFDERVDETQYPDALQQRVLGSISESAVSPEEASTLLDEVDWEEARSQARQEGRADGLREGRADGLREGRADGLREAVVDLCELLGIEIDEGRRAHLASLDETSLVELRKRLKAERSWPR